MIEKLETLFGTLEVRLELTDDELKVFERYFGDDLDYSKLPRAADERTIVVVQLGHDE